MFYCGGGEDSARYQIRLATSTDLREWTRTPGPLFRDGYDARDPFVVQIGKQWVMYYTANAHPDGGAYVVAYRTSSDLRHWSERHIAYTDETSGTNGGNTESPFVVARGGGYYLFIGPRNGYVSTEVFFSRNPYHFEGPPLAEYAAHAAEVVRKLDGTEYLSRAGWGQGGVDLAALSWECPAP